MRRTKPGGYFKDRAVDVTAKPRLTPGRCTDGLEVRSDLVERVYASFYEGLSRER